MSPRAQNEADAATAAELRRLGKERRNGLEALRAGVLAALDKGVSVRVIADLAQVSTATVQAWKAAARRTAGQ